MAKRAKAKPAEEVDRAAEEDILQRVLDVLEHLKFVTEAQEGLMCELEWHLAGERNATSTGDIVTLRSGGPPMTVSSAPKGGGQIECIWFDLQGTFRRRSFPAEAVCKVAVEGGRATGAAPAITKETIHDHGSDGACAVEAAADLPF